MKRKLRGPRYRVKPRDGVRWASAAGLGVRAS